ncbi:MAG: DinB family protein [Saprospiraceae bacterium]
MEATFKIWKSSRKLSVQFFENYTLDQLNKIPAGFNNNLIWNIGHIIVTQQSLAYLLSSLPMHISSELLAKYRSGTKPAEFVELEEVNELKELLSSLVDSTIGDFNDGKFLTYIEKTTSTGFHLANIQDGFQFNNYHEALHLGYMMSIRKMI